MRFAFPRFMAALADGFSIITPNPTLASVAVEHFNRSQLALGNSSWERPRIQSLDAWMIDCWNDARFSLKNPPLLLSLLQERELWRQIISRERRDLFDARAMASMAQRASRILAEHQIPVAGEGWVDHPDALEFQRWFRILEARLKAENWITRSELWRLLPDLIKPVPTTFVGIGSISPGLKPLSRALGDSVEHIGISYGHRPAIADAIRFDSTAHELEHVARRVRYLLETGQSKSIGILVADLPSHARDLARTFQEVLYPSSTTGDHVHLQVGKMIETPLISHALLLLELAQTRVNHASAGAILRSPFIDGAGKERSLRALADAKLRRLRELDFSIIDLDKAAWDCPIFFQILRRISTIVTKLAPVMRLSDWSARFSEILDAAKWPALGDMSEAEQSAVDAWSGALSDLASLGLVSPPVSLNEALAQLKAILSRPSHLGGWSSPVQILDANSAEGIEFDHSFALNVGEDFWPSPIALSPLIPYRLQRLQQVPASHPEGAAEERARKTDALFTSAPIVQVSYSGTLSPAIRPYIRMASPNDSQAWRHATASQAYDAAALESQEDGHAPALQQLQGTAGGAGVIKAQSLCPFKAFAEYRLNAKGDDEACVGFDALERGNCAHRALELIWTELGSQQNLKALSEHDLLMLIERHVEQAVKASDADGPIGTLTSSAERERLVNVVLQWLTIEKARSVSFEVEHVEAKQDVEISGLRLSLRMDRVDRLPDGGRVLIDYKSGAQTVSKLEGDRPKEPQLLVYATVLDAPVDGIYFGELKNRRVRPVGHGLKKYFPKQGGTKDHPADWDHFMETSKDAVYRLADEFRQGEAAVSPQRGACAYCKVKPICRIGAAADGEEEEE